MNELTILSNKLILDTNRMSKLIAKCVTKIFYVYDQAFKVGVVGNIVSSLDVGCEQIWRCPCKHIFVIFLIIVVNC